jgi:hypothetical protein
MCNYVRRIDADDLVNLGISGQGVAFGKDPVRKSASALGYAEAGRARVRIGLIDDIWYQMVGPFRCKRRKCLQGPCGDFPRQSQICVVGSER